MSITTKVGQGIFLLGLLFAPHITAAKSPCAGKAEIAPTFLHIDILESGRTVQRMDMPAVRAELTYLLWKGFYLRPVVLYGNGGSGKGGTMNGSLVAGGCLPLNDQVKVSAFVGISYSHLWTKVDFPSLQLKNLREKFKSLSPLVGVDMYYTIQEGLRASVSVQYAWARTHTSIQNLVKRQKSNSKGFNYACQIERDLDDNWSLNVGAAYSLSLSKEKHGIRGAGIKLGLARWF